MKISQALNNAPLHERVAALTDELSATERRVAEYMAQNPDEVAVASATQLAEATGASDATVVRTARALGYPGLRELKRALIETLTRRQNPASVLDDRLGRIARDGHDYDRVLADTVDLVQQLRASMDAATWQTAVETVHEAHRVFTYGIGPASSIADYLAIMFNRIGVEAHSWALTGFRLADALLNLRSDDAVVIFAPLRLFREIDVIIQHANNLGARVIVVSEALGLSLADRADVVLATPQSTTNAASELTAGHLLAHALTLAVAARSRDRAVQTMETLNQLRSNVAGTDLDRRALHAIEPERAD